MKRARTLPGVRAAVLKATGVRTDVVRERLAAEDGEIVIAAVLPIPDGEVTEVHAVVTGGAIEITLVNFQGWVVRAESDWGTRGEPFKRALENLLAELAALRWMPVAQLEAAHD